MKILFKIEIKDDEKNIIPLFPSADSTYKQTGLHTIVKAMRDLIPEDKRENIKFISLYAGNHEFNDNSSTGHKNTFYALVRIKDGIPDKILDIDKYSQWRSCDLLNKENKDKSIFYEEFEIEGELI